MPSNYFLDFANKGLLNLRNLLEQNETMLNANTSFPLDNMRRRRVIGRQIYNENEEPGSATLFGIPLIFVILIALLFITIVACTAIAIWCWCENRKSKEHKPDPDTEEKEEDDKNIEMSQMKKDDNCGHININSLN